MACASSLVFFIFCHLLFLSSAEQVTGFNPKCPPLPCGVLGNISFPFSPRTHPECGLLVVDNCDTPLLKQQIQLGKDGPSFYVAEIRQDNTLVLRDHPDQEFSKSHCALFQNLTLSSTSLYSFEYPDPSTVLNCSNYSSTTKLNLMCKESNHSLYYSYTRNGWKSPPAGCSVIQALVNKTSKYVLIYDMYTGSFRLRVNVIPECHECYLRGGQCSSDSNANFNCSGPRKGNLKGHIKIVAVGKSILSNSKIVHKFFFLTILCMSLFGGSDNPRNHSNFLQSFGIFIVRLLSLIAVIAASGIGVLIILALCFTKRLSSINFMVIWEKKCKNYHNIEAFLRNHGTLAPKRYNYSDIKRMTNSFKHKLGQGGYGGVFKGKLLDGRDVAVKVLNGSKGNGEDFINEVASISRTSHVNIVGLFGYCFESNRRALIYEFVPNGSLEKFIYEKYSTYKHLKWEKLYQIALGIARGLEYLHRGCSTKIVHFDIKPHNILLDEDFCPKISDFGLAKVCPRIESIISMTGARGTVGYIAPEVFCRNFGDVSHKSDVYSYGMMILEMVGGRKNLDVGVGQTSQIYFPHWIYKRLEVDEELGLQDIENEEENKCARRMLIVSLWCIQTNPSSRPTMSRVMELLEASLDSLPFPPKPFLSSPRSEAADSSLSLVC